jgi:hypothetical protein
MRLSSMILALAIAIPFASDAFAAPALANDRKIDIELREVEVKEVFKLLGEISETKVMVDPCVHGKVDIRLKNTPASLVFDALANKLGLVYAETSKGVEVTCRASASPTAPEAARVSLVEHATPMPEAVAHLAKEAHLEGVDYRATRRPDVSVTLERVKVGTALAVLAETSGLSVRVEKGKVVVSE